MAQRSRESLRSHPSGFATDGPRERVAREGARALADSELITLIVGSGGRTASAKQLSEKTLRRLGGLRGLAAASFGELHQIPGIGAAKACALLAAFELGRRFALSRLEIGVVLRDPERVFQAFHARVRDARQESFWVLLLDGRHRLKSEVLISQGTLTASLVHPREVFCPALRESAAAVVLVHNHPSGDPSPSREDFQVTRRLARAGALLGIQVIDHVVVAEAGYRSLREAGALGGFDTSPG